MFTFSVNMLRKVWVEVWVNVASFVTSGPVQIFDGHNGSAAALFTKENLLPNVTSALPSGLSRDEWLAALPRAMVAGFVKTDKDWQSKGTPYGTLRGINTNFLVSGLSARTST